MKRRRALQDAAVLRDSLGWLIATDAVCNVGASHAALQDRNMVSGRVDRKGLRLKNPPDRFRRPNSEMKL